MIQFGPQVTENNHCVFKVWAPEKKRMMLHLVHPFEEIIEMQPVEGGYYIYEKEGAGHGTRYFYRPDDSADLPDPASHFQPEGVHGPSEVIDHNQFQWTDNNWKGIPFNELILYELHVGTFTPEGTFEAIIPRLAELAETGINALELMPVSQFPGSRNWGYDRVYPYSVQNSYGGPFRLKKLVDACHQLGIAIFIDKIYNHQGPEGNYLSHFGPYFTDWYKTPWGEAINFDKEWSDGVRDYFSMNAVFWFDKYHVDGLRLDAVHEVYDKGAVNFWELTHDRIKALEQKAGRPFYTIAESDLNSPKIIQHPEAGGYGFTAQLLDDFHHALYVMLDKEGKEHYIDFGNMEQLAKAYTEGYVHSGDYVEFRKRKHGRSSAGIPGNRFVVFNQNHDIVGNRAGAERLSLLVNFEQLKVAAAAMLLSPYVPMLFMGEEFGADTPFYYFISHSDKNLVEAVREGRRKEFEGFNWNVEPPDPQAEDTFEKSKLLWEQRNKGKHAILLSWHKYLITLRKTLPSLLNFNKNEVRATTIGQSGIVLYRQNPEGQQHLACLFNFSELSLDFTLPFQDYEWDKLVDSKDSQWLENGSEMNEVHPVKAQSKEYLKVLPWSAVVYSGMKKVDNM